MKRTVALIIAVSLLFMFPISNAAAKSSGTLDKINEAAKVLVGLKIMPPFSDGAFHPEFEMTRGELAKILGNIYGKTYQGQAASKYSDVEEEELSRAVSAAAGLGLMPGFPDGTFRPDLQVTFIEVVKMAVKMLGYEVYTGQLGGDPDGYFTEASNLHLLDGLVVADMDQPINRGTVALILYRTFHTNMLEKVALGDQVSYSDKNEKKILQEACDIYYEEGIVTGTKLTHVNDKSALQDGYIEIDSNKYLVDDAINDNALIGLKVKYYYYDGEEADIPSIRYMERTGVKESEYVRIDARDIYSYKNNKYEYSNPSDKTETVRFDKTANVIYNEQFKGDLAESDFVPANGMVELYDTKGTGSYDLVKITNYTAYVVNAIDPDTYTVIDKHDTSKKVCLDPDVNIVEVKTEAGKRVDPLNLKEWDVLTLKVSADEDVIVGVLTKSSQDVKLLSVQDHGTYLTVETEEASLETVKGYYHEGDVTNMIGKTVRVCLDAYGRIVSIEMADTVRSVAYLIEAMAERASLDKISFRILDTKGEIKRETATLPIAIDGVRYKKTKDAYNALLTNGVFRGNVVIVERNSEGAVVALDTPAFNADQEFSKGSLRMFFTSYQQDTRTVGDATKQLYYKSNSGIFAYTNANYTGHAATQAQTQACISSSTAVFYVPASPGAVFNKDDYQVGKISDFSNDKSYDIEAYAMEESYGYADCIVRYNNAEAKQISDSSAMGLVDKVTSVYDDTLGIAKKIKYYMNGSIVEGIFDREELANGIESGDVIRVKRNDKGFITSVKKYYDYSEKKIVNSTNTEDSTFSNYYEVERNITGYVFSKYNNFIAVISDLNGLSSNTTYAEAANRIELHKGTGFKICIYDSSKPGDKVTVANIDQVRDYMSFGRLCSRVFIGTRYGDPMTMVIYK